MATKTRRVVGVLLIGAGAAVSLMAIKNFRADRQHLRQWHRGEARIDSVRVVRVPPSLPYSLGGHGALLAITIRREGSTHRGKYVDPAWARLTYSRARRDADEALARGTIPVLIDPADPLHISIRPEDPVYFYRDAWQAALLGMLLLAIGFLVRGRR